MSTAFSRARNTAPALLFLTYVFLSSDAQELAPGLPWRIILGTSLVASLLIGMVAWIVPTARKHSRSIAFFAAAVALKLVLVSFIVPQGWASQFSWAGGSELIPIERIGRHLDDGRVIDRSVILSNRSPAFQFLNDGNSPVDGPDAAINASVNAQWQGFVFLDEETPISFTVTGGEAVVSVDGRSVGITERSTPLPAGVHQLNVTFEKPKGVHATLAVDVASAQGPLVVYPLAVDGDQLDTDRQLRRIVLVLNVLVLLAFALWTAWLIVDALSALRGVSLVAILNSRWCLVAIPIALFGLHGLLAAHSDLTVFLIGDDMRKYASDGRDIALHGILANNGAPLFQGEPFYFYPLYPYFVAMSHLLFDESIYGVVLLQFVLLGVTMGAIAGLALEMFGAPVAWGALLMLCGLGEMDFVRYYTISIFTDNLYYPLVALSVAALYRLEVKPTTASAIAAGVLGGLATITRPSMFFFMPIAVAWYFRPRSSASARLKSSVLKMAAAFMAVVLVVTLRNWLVSGRVVLIAESSLQVLFFLAPPGVEYSEYLIVPRPSITQTLQGVGRMFLDHPWAVILVELRKLGFMLGFTNLGFGYSLHPEFLALSATYFGCWWLRRATMPGTMVHLTLLAHVVAFEAASPMTYGYKTMLTLMMLTVPFSAAFLAEAIVRVVGRPQWLGASGRIQQA